MVHRSGKHNIELTVLDMTTDKSKSLTLVAWRTAINPQTTLCSTTPLSLNVCNYYTADDRVLLLEDVYIYQQE